MMKKTIILAFVLLLAITGSAIGTGDDGAKTSPPPEDPNSGLLIRDYEEAILTSSLSIDDGGSVGTMGSFCSCHMYLATATNSFGYNSTYNLYFSGTTSAYESVQTIYVSARVQQWTGSYWKNYSGLSENSEGFTSFTVSGASVTVSPGFYYRNRTSHSINHFGIYESGFINSSVTYVMQY